MASLADTYRKHTDIGHVLHAPDMYIGPIQPSEMTNWVMDQGKMLQCTHSFIPALYKIFDEIVVNAADQSKRKEDSDAPVTYIKCTIKDGTITVVNDGPGIDVEIHPEYQVYIPQLIFAELRTSTNYNTSEKRIVGGKNGFGAKLAFIWSTYAKIETVDSVRGLKYSQEFHSNLSKIDKPTITSYKKKPYTSITFTPDYARFGIKGLDDSMLKLFEKRVMDIAAVTHKRVKVSFNEVVLAVRDFPHYIDLYLGDTPKVVESHPRWELGAAFVEEHHQVSFVNGIYTQKGGKHVDYFMNQLIRKMTAYIHSKKKIEVRPAILRDRLFVFIHCFVENPTFDSQTKDYLSTPSNLFGSSFEISDKFVKKLVDSGFMEVAVSMTQQKELAMAKKNDGAKTRTIRGIPKLIDANRAGTVESGKCTLILTEGDSAAASVVSGLSKEDRNLIGVYPMRGKMLNTRGETITRINQNKEIQELRQIIGLELGKKYTAADIGKTLRYGKILFITDQDKDGSHIKGLGVNMFGSLWETLLEQRGFIGYMNTPIIKARKGKEELLFYNDVQYDEWKTTSETRGWDIKYYKGLGTSTSKEFIQYFKDKEKLTVVFECTETCKDTIDMVFNKSRADDRKRWLEQYSKHATVDTRTRAISYDTFIHKELSHFSNYDCIRSIPNLMDGFKPSQRKVLFASFKRRLTKEIKVAQLSGYVSEHTAYHHGEASLNGTIVGMAQDFVGSNNIELLKPNGQFGTRLNGGKDRASERYIFTELSKWTRFIFPEEDDPILEYVVDDGDTVEPIYYLPIIPMILVNGCKGIGTGTSTHVLCYNPLELIDALLAKLDGKEMSEIHPYYRGFMGTIEDSKEMKYTVKGKYTQKELIVHITELPIGVWTIDYKEYLEELIGTVIKEYTDNSTDKEVNIQVKLLKPVDDVEKVLKLASSLSIKNMNLYNAKEMLTHYTDVHTIIREFYEVRWTGYEKRKEHQLKALQKDLHKIKNKVEYIRALVKGTLDLRNKKTDVILSELAALKIEPHDGSYHYLIKLPMDSVTAEKVVELETEYKSLIQQIQELEATTIQMMWTKELMHLKKVLNK
jgi:DNA topoisomerase-2